MPMSLSPASRAALVLAASGSLVLTWSTSATANDREATGSGYVQTQKLVPDDLGADIRFPYSIEADGRTAVTGAKWDDVGGLGDAGSAYVYERRQGQWIQTAKLVSPDPTAGEEFGLSVEISGDVILVGAPYCTNDLRGSEIALPAAGRNCPAYVGSPQQRPPQTRSDRPGTVYAFRRSGRSWVYEATLRAPVGADVAAGDTFGWSMGFDGRTAVISAPWGDGAGSDSGASYVFERSRGRHGGDARWRHVQTLVPSDLAANDNLGYGYGTFIDGRHIVIGAYHADTAAGINTGAAWAFRRTHGGWVEESKLVPSDASPFGDFGHSVTIDRDRVLIGSPGRRIPGGPPLPVGAAYIFDYERGEWTESAMLLPPDPDPVTVFGVSNTLAGDTAIVVAPAKSLTTDAGVLPGTGAAYVFKETRDGWVFDTRLVPDDPAPGDTIHEAEILGDTVFLGAAGKTGDNGEFEQGALYVFSGGR